jgi:hypothetical protein
MTFSKVSYPILSLILKLCDKRREDPDPDPEEHMFMDPDPVYSEQLTYLDPVRVGQWSNPAPQRQPAPVTRLSASQLM